MRTLFVYAMLNLLFSLPAIAQIADPVQVIHPGEGITVRVTFANSPPPGIIIGLDFRSRSSTFQDKQDSFSRGFGGNSTRQISATEYDVTASPDDHTASATYYLSGIAVIQGTARRLFVLGKDFTARIAVRVENQNHDDPPIPDLQGISMVH